ncbi:MAG: hypothetical protein KA436_05740 [Oligoflexales bacterium]|nr:hypothetical protein [Oligoflexales bacterium]
MRKFSYSKTIQARASVLTLCSTLWVSCISEGPSAPVFVRKPKTNHIETPPSCPANSMRLASDKDMAPNSVPWVALSLQDSSFSVGELPTKGGKTNLILSVKDSTTPGFFAWKLCDNDGAGACEPWAREYGTDFPLLPVNSGKELSKPRLYLKRCISRLEHTEEKDRAQVQQRCTFPSASDPADAFDKPEKWCCADEKSIALTWDVTTLDKSPERLSCVQKERGYSDEYFGLAQGLIQQSRSYLSQFSLLSFEQAQKHSSLAYLAWNISSYDPAALALMLDLGSVEIENLWAMAKTESSEEGANSSQLVKAEGTSLKLAEVKNCPEPSGTTGTTGTTIPLLPSPSRPVTVTLTTTSTTSAAVIPNPSDSKGLKIALPAVFVLGLMTATVGTLILGNILLHEIAGYGLSDVVPNGTNLRSQIGAIDKFSRALALYNDGETKLTKPMLLDAAEGMQKFFPDTFDNSFKEMIEADATPPVRTVTEDPAPVGGGGSPKKTFPEWQKSEIGKALTNSANKPRSFLPTQEAVKAKEALTKTPKGGGMVSVLGGVSVFLGGLLPIGFAIQYGLSDQDKAKTENFLTEISKIWERVKTTKQKQLQPCN